MYLSAVNLERARFLDSHNAGLEFGTMFLPHETTWDDSTMSRGIYTEGGASQSTRSTGRNPATTWEPQKDALWGSDNGKSRA